MPVIMVEPFLLCIMYNVMYNVEHKLSVISLDAKWIKKSEILCLTKLRYLSKLFFTNHSLNDD